MISVASPIRSLALLSMLIPLAGCADGPFHGLYHLNPIVRNQWDQDRQLGPTFHDRREELQKLRGQLPGMNQEEQAKWYGMIEQLLERDPSPDIRREAVLCLRGIDHPEATRILNLASQDESDKVRLAVCDAYGDRLDAMALTKLGELAQQDENLSVRVAAIRQLGRSSSEESRKLLAQTLQDKSPSVQFESTLALQKNTGKALGSDVAVWKRFLDGEEVEEPSIIATQWNQWFGSPK